MGEAKIRHEHEWELFRVRFKNGTVHVARICACGKRGGFEKKTPSLDIASLPERKTDREIRIESGLPIGCRICGTENHVQIIGFCSDCRKSKDAQMIKTYAKENSKTIWELSNNELAEAQGIELLTMI